MLYLFILWSFLCGCILICQLLLELKGIITADEDEDPMSHNHKALQTNKYDVFVSFRGEGSEEIRSGFLSHLAAAFKRKKIDAFVDEKLEKGEEIWPSLAGAIEGSSISVIIFSKDYASSPWCLKELVKILECREKYGQKVIPVFYRVDPADVRHQRGSYKTAFAKHAKRYGPAMLKIWRKALKTNLLGIKSSDSRTDVSLLENIINDVLRKLKRLSKPTLNSKRLVGIGKAIADIEALLLKESKDVRMIGIWGMGGIGKTTIAEQVFKKICSEYEGSCFLSNVREEFGRHGAVRLKEKIFSTILVEDVTIQLPSGMSDDIGRRIGRMKVLIVLDDVSDSDQLELFGTVDDFGFGSRIIVTTRDQQLLKAKKVDDIHEVGVLSSSEALNLFNLTVFNQSHLEMEYHELSKRVVDYAKGIPLVLKVLGHLLHGKEDKEVWESQLDKLKEMPIKEVYDVMRLSYDDLDRREKNIFLDLACFLNGLNLKVDYIKTLLKDHESDKSVAHGLERLKDKALIIISEHNVVSVHDIIQEMAWEIVHQESNENIGNQSQLGNADDIADVLENDKGTHAIRSIRMNLSTIKSRKLKLSSDVFVRMSKLRFLDFYSVRNLDCSDFLPEGLQSFPNKIRFLRWMCYPLESLPEQFYAEKLVVLHLKYSRVEKLWDGVQNLVNLKHAELEGCEFLKELPDFSKATNLQWLIASNCCKLTSVHPSIFSLNKLEGLDLSGCVSLTWLTSHTHLSCLSYLNLLKCKNLTEFSVTSENMIELNLKGTRINALPPSFGSQRKLESLVLESTEIESLPSCMVNLTSLRFLNLRKCLKLQTLPQLPPSLETLLILCCPLKTVLFPLTAVEQFQENKKRVEFWKCKTLDEYSLMAIGLNARINVMRYADQHLSALKHDYVENYDDYFHSYHSYQAMHVFPGSEVPHWLVYKTTGDSVMIDLSSPPPSPPFGFIFSFITETRSEYNGYTLKFKVTIRVEDDAGDDENDSIEVYMSYEPTTGRRRAQDHVCVIYDQRCSRYLSSRLQNLSRFEIKVTLGIVGYGPEQMIRSKGLGVSLISTSEYDKFIQEMDLYDSWSD